MKKHIIEVKLGLIFFILWEVIARIVNLNFVFPTPSLVAKRFWELKKTLIFHHLPATLNISLISIIISLVIGFSLAILMSENKKIEDYIYPIIVTTQTIPIIAIAPVFILWFGYGSASKILVAVISTFFSITISLHQGLSSVNKDYLDYFKSLGASKKDIFFKLKLPSILPFLFSALKMSLPYAIVGATIGEWLGGNRGLGYFSKRMMTQLDGAGVFAPIVLMSVTAIILVKLVSFTENKIIKWKGR